MLTEDDILQRLRVDADTVSILCADEANEIAGTIDELRKECRARGEEIARLNERLVVLREALDEAIEGWEDGASYKGDYLREKHGDAEGIAKARAALKETEANE